VRVAVRIEDIDRRKLADGQCHVVGSLCAGELIGAGRKANLLAPQIDDLAQKEAGRAVIRIGRADLVRLAAREPGQPEGDAEPEALVDFGIGVDGRAAPEAQPRVQRQIDGLAPAVAGVQAVGPPVRGSERGVILSDVRELSVQAPRLRRRIRVADGRSGEVPRERRAQSAQQEPDRGAHERRDYRRRRPAQW